VPIAESIRGFKEILEGKHDDLPERAFFLKGTIDDVVKEAAGTAEDERDRADKESEDTEVREDESAGDSKHDSDE